MSGCCSFLPCCPERVSFKALLWEALPESIAWRGQVKVIDPKEEPNCCVTVVLSRIFAEVIAGLSFLDVPGNIVLATLKLAALPIVLIAASCSECCAVFWQAMGNYYDAICDLLLGMTVLFSWVYPDLVYWSMQNAKIDSLLKAISQEYTSLDRASAIASEIAHDTQDPAVRTRAAVSLLDKLGKEPLTKENIERVFSVVNVLAESVQAAEDTAVSAAVMAMIRKAADQVPVWENLPLLFQVIDGAHRRFADNVGVRVTTTHACLRDLMKKEGCSADNLLKISGKFREHLKKGDEIYKQAVAEEIGALLQSGEERFGKDGGARIFKELEAHYFPDFKDHLKKFDWQVLTARYAAPVAEVKEEEESDTDSVDSHVIRTPKGASAPATLQTPASEATPQAAAAAAAQVETPPGSPRRSPAFSPDIPLGQPVTQPQAKTPEAAKQEAAPLSPTPVKADRGNSQGGEEPVAPTTPLSASRSPSLSPADGTGAAAQAQTPVEEGAEPQTAATPDKPNLAATPFSSPQEPPQLFVTPGTKSKLGPAQRVPASGQLPTADKAWLMETRKKPDESPVDPMTASPATQAALNTDALNSMGLSPMSPPPHPIPEERLAASLSPLDGTPVLTSAEKVEARLVLKETRRLSLGDHEDHHEVTFHDGDPEEVDSSKKKT